MPPKVLRRDGNETRTALRVQTQGEDDSDVEMDDAVSDQMASPVAARKAPSMALKAIKAREKALVDKFAVVQANIQNDLEKDDGVVVDCFFHAKEKRAPMDKSYDYTHLMKLVSPMPFVLVKQTILTEGEYAGHVAILVKQSLPFPLMRLPISVRTKVLNFMLKHDEEAIRVSLSQGGKKAAYSKEFHGKNTLAILATCKQIRDEAAPLLYGQTFVFPGTGALTTFLLQIGQFSKYLRHLELETYTGASARTMFHLLEKATSLEILHFQHISSNERPKTAVKNIYNDAYPWLMAVGKECPTKGLEIMHFHEAAFHRRDKNENGEPESIKWSSAEHETLRRGLRLKLEKASRANASS
ncbi:uncharacterized protein EI97DRAFT_457510 [Westerdykella ornata]|uniref:Uncharacterized protein n=1 Tax=Westerdykella ornata TaxID=318751 RepID=A0A6A6JLW9_WESOR|nr:uncharacterized protein EI97DRAFT_457510 [Westerdykella ornata]KAF2277502.1 hypothetical protein EI97DRAFT_457510 [Westerdykella ornata]